MHSFLPRFAPTNVNCTPLVASRARLAGHVPSVVRKALQSQFGHNLRWANTERTEFLAWLWLILMVLLLLQDT